jgi:aryl-alcohol dehydrogenase-like predicted oxidoreductase
VDPNLTIDDRVGVLVDMKAEGKIRHVGLSEADVDQLKAAQKITPIMSVQNLANRSVNHCSTKPRPRHRLHPLVPEGPLAANDVLRRSPVT